MTHPCASWVPAMVEATHAESQLITINVQTLSGSLPPITISAQTSIRELKQRVQALDANFGIDRQKLMISDPRNEEGDCVVLLNHRTLQSYAMVDSTNVMLAMLPQPDVEVSIDDDLKDIDRFTALMLNGELRAALIEVSSVDIRHAWLLQLFEANRVIRSIKISGCWTAEHLQFCESLVALRPDVDIRCVFDSQPDTELLFRVLSFCSSNRCSSIAVSRNQFYAAGFVSLAPSLQSLSSLQHLNLSNNGIGVEGCASLAPALHSMSFLHYLDLSSNDIGYEGCTSLASALQSMPSLQHLNLNTNVIGAVGCATLAPALQSMSSLQHFDLSNNKIGAAGCAYMATALQSMSSLQHLDLKGNQLGAVGCKKLAPALRLMISLQHLNLSLNGIDAAGFSSLASALQSVLALQHLNLSWNYFRAEGCKKLASSLPSMSSLRHLDLRGNEIGAAGRALLAPALHVMPWLRFYW